MNKAELIYKMNLLDERILEAKTRLYEAQQDGDAAAARNAKIHITKYGKQLAQAQAEMSDLRAREAMRMDLAVSTLERIIPSQGSDLTPGQVAQVVAEVADAIMARLYQEGKDDYSINLR